MKYVKIAIFFLFFSLLVPAGQAKAFTLFNYHYGYNDGYADGLDLKWFGHPSGNYSYYALKAFDHYVEGPWQVAFQAIGVHGLSGGSYDTWDWNNECKIKAHLTTNTAPSTILETAVEVYSCGDLPMYTTGEYPFPEEMIPISKALGFTFETDLNSGINYRIYVGWYDWTYHSAVNDAEVRLAVFVHPSNQDLGNTSPYYDHAIGRHDWGYYNYFKHWIFMAGGGFIDLEISPELGYLKWFYPQEGTYSTWSPTSMWHFDYKLPANAMDFDRCIARIPHNNNDNYYIDVDWLPKSNMVTRYSMYRTNELNGKVHSVIEIWCGNHFGGDEEVINNYDWYSVMQSDHIIWYADTEYGYDYINDPIFGPTGFFPATTTDDEMEGMSRTEIAVAYFLRIFPISIIKQVNDWWNHLTLNLERHPENYQVKYTLQDILPDEGIAAIGASEIVLYEEGILDEHLPIYKDKIYPAMETIIHIVGLLLIFVILFPDVMNLLSASKGMIDGLSYEVPKPQKDYKQKTLSLGGQPRGKL